MLEFASVPLGDGNTLLTYVDVTDSARIEEALRERAEALEAADRLKTGFMSNVSYELRTPLTNILGFSESLALGIAGTLEAKQQDYVRHIQTSSQDLLAIIDAILDLTTIDAGAMELALDAVDVPRAMEETAESLAEWIGKRDLTLTIEVAEDATSFRGDPKRVRQIIHNLLTNAIGFSTEGGSVRMGARRDGSDILLWVADTGKGIDPEFQKRAFDRFQSSPVLGGHRGPGLGLAIVKSFVELHEGKVSLLSQVNKGTTVVCRFPADRPAQQAAIILSIAFGADGRGVSINDRFPTMSVSRELPTAEATERLGHEIALVARPGTAILLEGDLGAGKTTLARAIIRSLSGGIEIEVPSPTFTLVQTYEGGRMPVAHADLYRLGDGSEVGELGLADLARTHLLIIEWPDRLDLAVTATMS